MNIRGWILALGWVLVAVLATSSDASAQTVYLSAGSSGQVQGVSFANEDIVAYDMEAQAWSLHFDGSDVGLALNDVDAFELRDDGSILLSLRYAGIVSGVGLVDDSDILRFVPTSLGTTTSGTFELLFDASDVGLFFLGQDLDAVSLAPVDGSHPVPRLVWSIRGTLLGAPDEDLTVFNATSLGSNTSGTAVKYFDGSDVALSLPSEDVASVSIDPATGDIYLSTTGFYSVPGLSGDNDDIFVCDPTSLGETTACTYRAFFNGDTVGFNEAIDGLHVNVAPADDVDPTITIIEPANGSTWTERVGLVQITYSDPSPGSGIDESSFVLTLDGVDVTASAVVGPTSVTYAVVSPLSEGPHELRARVSDEAGNESEAVSLFTVDEVALEIAITSPAPLSSVYAQPITVSGTVTSPIAAVTVNGIQALVQGGGFVASGVPLAPGVNQITATATRLSDMESAEVVAIFDPNGAPVLPPDPATVAPAIDPTKTTSVLAATSFLYQGANSIQTGVAAGTIAGRRVALLRGQARTSTGTPLSGVRVSVLDHSELGSTFTRADGRFDLVVNGGGPLTVVYEKFGFPTAQRMVDVAWRSYLEVPEIRMVAYDTAVTNVTLTGASPMQMARGRLSLDADGQRQATLLFPGGVTAQLLLPSGTTQPISTLHVRATEYTVGDDGPSAMPAALPSTSGYTYAVELSVDEAIAAGAEQVQFSAPIPFYIENFLGFADGLHVPAGFYDRRRGAWLASPDGRVVRVVAIANGLAEMDVTGDGMADAPTVLASLGITQEERDVVADLYAVGQSLWRVPVPHFSPLDLNWAVEFPPDAEQPLEADRPDGQCEGAGLDGEVGACPEPERADDPEDDPCTKKGSILECSNQVLREEVPIVGTALSLAYRSDRLPGKTDAYTMRIPVTRSVVPASLRRVDVTMEIAGRTYRQEFAPAPSVTTEIPWDGLDAYGRRLQGAQMATVYLDYIYDVEYGNPDNTFMFNFGLYPATTLATGIPGRAGSMLRRSWTAPLGDVSADLNAMGGWTLSVHHAYDPLRRMLLRGDGRRDQGLLISDLDRVGGIANTPGFSGDGGPALDAKFSSPRDFQIAADGAVFLADIANARVRRIDPDGVVSTYGGVGPCITPPPSDGTPALNSCLPPQSVDLGPDGSAYLIRDLTAGFRAIYRIRPDQTVEHVAGGGGGVQCDPGNPAPTPFGVPATGVNLTIGSSAVGSDGTVYFTNGYCRRSILKVGADGLLQLVAGHKVQNGITPDGQLATSGPLGQTADIAVGPDGVVYFAEISIIGGPTPTQRFSIRRIATDGTLSTLLGPTPFGFNGDGGPALSAGISSGTNSGLDLEVDSNGNVWIADTANHRVRRITPDGVINTVLGDGVGATSEDALRFPTRVVIAPDGVPYVGQSDKHIISQVVRGGPGGFLTENIRVASSDGSELYEFAPDGRHLTTLSSLTGATLLTFGYDASGRLASVQNADGLTTQIERDTSGNPQAIVAPFGQRTQLSVNGQGYLASVRNPASQQHTMQYAGGGLMSMLRQPGGAQTSFAYNAVGRMTGETNTLLQAKALTRTQFGSAARVEFRTPLGRSSLFSTRRTQLRDNARVRLEPDGVRAEIVRSRFGRETTTFADGTTSVRLKESDPSVGVFAPIVRDLSVMTPGGLLSTRSHTRTATINPTTGILQSRLDTFNVNGRISTEMYDGPSRLLTSTSARGRVATDRFDVAGRVIETGVGGIEPTRRIYDAQGRISTIEQGTGAAERTAVFTYDAEGNLQSFQDPAGRVISYLYDARGQVTETTLPDSRKILHTYDADGRSSSVAPPGRPPHLFGYTAVGEESAYTPPPAGAGSFATSFQYDFDRNLTSIDRPDGDSIVFQYDTSGRISSVQTARGVTTQAYHPVTGLLTNVTAPGAESLVFGYDGSLPTSLSWSGTISGVVAATYDPDHRLALQTVNGASPISFGYDDDGFLVQAGSLAITRSSANGLPTGTTLGVVTTAQQYSSFGEVASDSASISGTALYQNAYTRDKLGRVAQKIETIGGTTRTLDYAYDLAGRLIEVKANGVAAATYAYDANGNRTSRITPLGTETATYDDQDRLTQYGSTSFTWDAAGDLATKVSSAGTTNYGYDALGNLTAANLPDGRVIEYVIDGRNRRIGKKVDGVLVAGWLYQDQYSPVAELDPSGNVLSRFVYGSRENAPDYMVRGGSTYRILHDQVGSVRLVIDAASGSVVQRLDYDEWGNVTQDTNPGFQPFGFAGGLLDRDTGLVRFGARDYDAQVGRWTTKDPIRFDGGFNLYEYAGGDPINFIDYTGLEPLHGYGEAFTYYGKTTGQALAAFADGVVPFADPFAGWVYDPCDEALGYSRKIGEYVRDAELALAGGGALTRASWFKNSALFGRNGTLFGKGTGLLNNNPVLRAGWGWKGSSTAGQNVFRISMGPAVPKSLPASIKSALNYLKHIDF